MMMFFVNKKSFFVVLLLIIASYIFIRIYTSEYYRPARNRHSGTIITKSKSDTIKIAFIGDSWAAMHQNHQCNIAQLLMSELNIPVEVRTAGVSGLTSKGVYYSIFDNKTIRRVVIDWGPNYCIIAAGVNDSDRKMGIDFYRENMKLIVDFLLVQGITPVLLEIPSYNAWRSFEVRDIYTKLQYLFSMLRNLSSMDCIEMYRNNLIDLIEIQGWTSQVIMICTDSWNSLGYEDERNIYDDLQMHLNESGYKILDSCIASSIRDDVQLHFLSNNY